MTSHVAGLIAAVGLLISSLPPTPPVAQDGIDQDEAQWPKTLQIGDTTLTIYQPQLEALKGDQLTARAAVSAAPKDAAAPVFGAFWFEARLLTDRDRRTAIPVDVRVTDVRFPQAAADLAGSLRASVGAEIPKWRLTLSLDHLLSELAALQKEKSAALNLKNDPPDIQFRNHPAVLVQIDGEPSWRPLEGGAGTRIANSAFFMVKDDAGTCTLHIPPFWWTASSPVGPWQALENPPPQAVAAWDAEPKPALPAEEPAQPAPERPEVLVATRPTELLVTQGPAKWAPIPGTGLLYVKNTDSDVFMEIQTQICYVLLSGRWYNKPAGKGKGTWTAVPPEGLPGDFSRIPLGSEKQQALASVPGTPQAHEAVLDAQIPQTAAVTPGPAPDLNVTYDGDPDFTEIEGSPVRYAINTPYSVFQSGGRYFCCQDGVWYDSSVAAGPWSVCSWVAPDIYLIPPSCPHYYCTYCHVFGVSLQAVYVGYYPGYRGCFISGPTVVYGTGWHYPSWHGSMWFPRPVTWGVGVHYNIVTGNWRFRLGATGPCAWLGVNRTAGAVHTYSVGVGGCWGGVGYSHTAIDVHHNQQFAVHASQGVGHNIYARRPERLAPIHHELPRAIPAVPAERRAPNSVYSDRQGNAFRRDSEGSWEQHTPQGWQKETPRVPPRESAAEVPRIEQHHQELELHNQARTQGQERMQNFQKNAPPRPPPPPPPRNPPPPPAPRNPPERRK